MKVYLDTEFTDFMDSRLISIGMVTEDGRRSFYAELTDNYTEADCSYFVLEAVLPLLDAQELPMTPDYRAIYARMTACQCSEHLFAWFEAVHEPVRVVTDSGYDQAFLHELFRDHRWPSTLDQKMQYVATDGGAWMRYAAQTEDVFARHPRFRRHHALDDARVMMKVMEEER